MTGSCASARDRATALQAEVQGGTEAQQCDSTSSAFKYRNRKVKVTALKISTEEPNSHQGNGEWLQITPGERFKVRTSVDETEGAYTMLEMVAAPRNGAPMHIHKNEDEHFIVLEGTLHIVNGDKTLDAPAGTAVTVSKGVPHGWCNLADTPVRMLLVFSPGKIEGLFKETAVRESDDIAALLDKFGVLIVGPALPEGIYTVFSPRA